MGRRASPPQSASLGMRAGRTIVSGSSGGELLAHAHYHGATPVEEALRWLDEHPELERRTVLPYRDRFLAMLGRFDEAHRLLDGVADRVAELGAWPGSRPPWRCVASTSRG